MILKETDQSLKGKIKNPYSDIIDLVIWEDYTGKMYNEILLWCNYDIRRSMYIGMNKHYKF
jgi:hypothetical protein